MILQVHLSPKPFCNSLLAITLWIWWKHYKIFSKGRIKHIWRCIQLLSPVRWRREHCCCQQAFLYRPLSFWSRGQKNDTMFIHQLITLPLRNYYSSTDNSDRLILLLSGDYQWSVLMVLILALFPLKPFSMFKVELIDSRAILSGYFQVNSSASSCLDTQSSTEINQLSRQSRKVTLLQDIWIYNLLDKWHHK